MDHPETTGKEPPTGAARTASLERLACSFETLLATSADGIVVTDRDDSIVAASESFCVLLGRTPHELVATDLRDALERLGSDVPARWAELASCTRRHGVCRDFELTLEPTGGRLEMSVNASLMASHGAGESDCLVALWRDVTARRAAERRLLDLAGRLERKQRELENAKAAVEQMATDLERSNQDLDDFVHIASHDLREPLRGIRTYSQFLLEDYGEQLDAEGRQRLATLPRLTDRLEELIESLLRYSRVGRTGIVADVTDLQELLTGVLDSLSVTIRERGATILVPRPLPIVSCDPSRVAEVFRNLIGNALKYNDREQPRVEIGYRRMRGAWRAATEPRDDFVFFVRDNGIGIREQHRDSVFTIFRRLHGRDQYGGGTGAGLTIVRKIVERHGGRIWVESTVGEGSTFQFTLEATGVAPTGKPAPTSGTP